MFFSSSILVYTTFSGSSWLMTLLMKWLKLFSAGFYYIKSSIPLTRQWQQIIGVNKGIRTDPAKFRTFFSTHYVFAINLWREHEQTYSRVAMTSVQFRTSWKSISIIAPVIDVWTIEDRICISVPRITYQNNLYNVV